jgi:hypothetical protein
MPLGFNRYTLDLSAPLAKSGEDLFCGTLARRLGGKGLAAGREREPRAGRSRSYVLTARKAAMRLEHGRFELFSLRLIAQAFVRLPRVTDAGSRAVFRPPPLVAA